MVISVLQRHPPLLPLIGGEEREDSRASELVAVGVSVDAHGNVTLRLLDDDLALEPGVACHDQGLTTAIVSGSGIRESGCWNGWSRINRSLPSLVGKSGLAVLEDGHGVAGSSAVTIANPEQTIELIPRGRIGRGGLQVVTPRGRLESGRCSRETALSGGTCAIGNRVSTLSA